MNKIFKRAQILLPNKNVDMQYWPTLACDQFTSMPQYWQQVQTLCNNKKSTIHITLPEVYLENSDVKERICKINETMAQYINDTLKQTICGFVYKKRYFPGKTHPLCGIVGMVDLEHYSYEAGDLPAIRPSENTVVSRIPPRLEIRKNAPLETPHILMLVDDIDKTVIEPIEDKINELECVYDTELMLEGGSVKGYAITDENLLDAIENAVQNIGSEQMFESKYPAAKGKTPLTMAVGDGNHSLATAKAHWQNIKANLSKSEAENHPARYCLVELINIHSTAIEIEPIHRAIFNANYVDFISEFKNFVHEKGAKLTVRSSEKTSENMQCVKVLYKNNIEYICIENSPYPLAVGTVEAFIDNYCGNKNTDISVDYIHGQDEVLQLAKQGAVGIILPEFEKSDIFKGVVLGGVLPRKTFSMGSAKQKRYYLECRKIVE